MLRPGFSDSVLGAQRTFRAALEAMAHPGRVVELPGPAEPPPPLTPATTALCLALLDADTPLWMDARAGATDVVEYLRFHCGCPLSDAAEAAFALVVDSHGVDTTPLPTGTDEEPERGATLIIQVTGLVEGEGHRLTGPGIAGASRVRAVGVPDDVWRRIGAASGRFPRGLDTFLVSRDAMIAVPRSTRIED